MESGKARAKVTDRIRHMVQSAMIKNRRYLEDEQLIRSEQLDVFDEIFNANVRDAEIKELSSHFAPVFRDDHPCHLAIWGKTGTGKTLTLMYFLRLLTEMCQTHNIPIRHVHLDLSNPRPCFRALNDLACLLNASRRYEKGISLEEMMFHVEKELSRYHGYLVLFIDEVDNVRHDRDNFMTFLVRRLPQQVPARVILVLVSNRLDWPDRLDPRVKSFLRMNELVFEPYNALDLQQILRIRVEKALDPGSVEPGVIEKIAALANREHGDARKAVQLLAKSAYWAEKAGSKLTTAIIDQAADELETDRYRALVRSSPTQMKAVMGAIIEANRHLRKGVLDTGEAYEAYKAFCHRADIRSLTGRAFGDLLSELDLYCLVRCRIISRGRYGRSREIQLDLPDAPPLHFPIDSFTVMLNHDKLLCLRVQPAAKTPTLLHRQTHGDRVSSKRGIFSAKRQSKRSERIPLLRSRDSLHLLRLTPVTGRLSQLVTIYAGACPPSPLPHMPHASHVRRRLHSHEPGIELCRDVSVIHVQEVNWETQ